jgi:hypothetical protein
MLSAGLKHEAIIALIHNSSGIAKGTISHCAKQP